MKKQHEMVVAGFDELGYAATFAGVARHIGLDPTVLYGDYPSREALGEAWLTACFPTVNTRLHLRDAFSEMPLDLFRTMERHRDFSRAWLAALTLTSPLHPASVQALRDCSAIYMMTWLDANERHISLPADMHYADVRVQLAEGLTAVAIALIGAWEVDRTTRAERTRRQVQSTGILLDALLIRRHDFGDASLLVHLHVVLGSIGGSLLSPVLDVLRRHATSGVLAQSGGLSGLLGVLGDLLPARS